jgi:hypothetical protein
VAAVQRLGRIVTQPLDQPGRVDEIREQQGHYPSPSHRRHHLSDSDTSVKPD